MNILFIGGTGNISGACAELLHERGHQVAVVTRGKSAVPPHFKAFVAERADTRVMRSIFETTRPDVVLDFIAFDVPEVAADYELCRGAVQQFIFISSATVYTRPAPKLPYTEDSPRGNSAWDYAQKKLACERWLEERWERERFPVTLVRPAHTYSCRWVPNVISSSTFSVAARLLEGKPVFVPDDGQIPWTLTAATDFAEGLAALVGRDEALGESFHITGDEVLTWNQIYGEIASALKVRDPGIVQIPTDFICQVAPQYTGNLRGDKAHPGIYDNSKLRKLAPGFKAKVPFREGIRQSIEWLLVHPEHQNLNPAVDQAIDQIVSSWCRHQSARR
jgi:nucleoside-diphosphate-sugar epimerase